MLTAEDRARVLTAVSGEQAFMHDFVAEFLDEVGTDIEALDEAINRNSAADVEQVAHGLKSVLGLFQALTPYELARDIEVLGKQGDFTGARTKFAELLPVLDDLKNVLASTL